MWLLWHILTFCLPVFGRLHFFTESLIVKVERIKNSQQQTTPMKRVRKSFSIINRTKTSQNTHKCTRGCWGNVLSGGKNIQEISGKRYQYVGHGNSFECLLFASPSCVQCIRRGSTDHTFYKICHLFLLSSRYKWNLAPAATEQTLWIYSCSIHWPTTLKGFYSYKKVKWQCDTNYLSKPTWQPVSAQLFQCVKHGRSVWRRTSTWTR